MYCIQHVYTYTETERRTRGDKNMGEKFEGRAETEMGNRWGLGNLHFNHRSLRIVAPAPVLANLSQK